MKAPLPSRVPSSLSSLDVPDLSLPIVDELIRIAYDSDDFRTQYLCGEILTKHKSLGDNPVSASERRRLAMEKLYHANNTCAYYNKALQDNTYFRTYPELHSIFHYARRIIGDLVGDVGVQDVLFGHFSGGAAVGLTYRESSYAKKYTMRATVTKSAYDLAAESIFSSQAWTDYRTSLGYEKLSFEIVPGNSSFTVDKTKEIDRAAAKEPVMNSFMQRGLGLAYAERLRRIGIDLSDQSRNQKLAKLGSIDNSYATIDLSAASDSISIALVHELFPMHLVDLMDALRCDRGVSPITGKPIPWFLYSTMGNGFTFELESLIFYALAKATLMHNNVRGTVSVYGDDIIVPNDMAVPVMHTLDICGFRPNGKKSFYGNEFLRESCGKHYYRGQDITPFYIRDSLNKTDVAILFLNNLRAWAANGLEVMDPRFNEIYFRVYNTIPKSLARQLIGGDDPNSISSIWSPGRPRKMISRVPIKHKRYKRLSDNDLDWGRYLYSLELGARDKPMYVGDPTRYGYKLCLTENRPSDYHQSYQLRWTTAPLIVR